MQKDIKFIKTFFCELNKKQIKYCILRKADLILDGKAHDIDMVVDYSRINEIYNILENLSKCMGWNKFFHTEKDNGNLISVHYYYIDERNINIVHFDLFKNFSWNNIPLIKNKDLLIEREYNNEVFSCSKPNEAITKLFSRYLYHGYVKDEYKEDIVNIFKNYKNEVISIIEKFLGNEYSNLIYCLILEENWNEIARLNNEVKKKIEILYFHSFSNKIKNKICNVTFKLTRYFKHNGVMVAFLGTDGSGKSTIIENLPEVLGKTFDKSQIKYYHWRPKYIKSPKKEKIPDESISQPHKKKPYGKIISILKFMYFNIDYIIGYWFSVKIHLGKNKLVVFDRYYYDYLIDKHRYRLNLDDTFISIMSLLIPKPNITFLLIGEPSILYDRKKELPLKELDRQIRKLNHEKSKIPNSKVIDVNNDIDKVIFDVSSSIINFMAVRNKHREKN